MKVDAPLTSDMDAAGARARRLEELGYDGAKVAETNHDPFLPLTLAAAATERIELVTSVAVAFARSPMTLAQTAHDLNAFCGGRLVLGLGSQVRPHIERRFAMPWGKPAARMREFISAMQAIFACWHEGERLDFRGEFYTHTLMPATFTPRNTGAGQPRIILSATGPLMTQVAAEVADGMMMHPFSTAAYMREVTLPAIERGLAAAGRRREDFVLDYAPMVATGADEEAALRAREAVRERIAFYARTVAYRPVLDLHGWGWLQDELIARRERGERQPTLTAAVPDEVVDAIAVAGEPDSVVAGLRKRLGGVIDRTGFHVAGLAEEETARLVAELKKDSAA